eukprot:symbB.v1.2.035272.t1/scaffold4709.1/size36042/1
MASHARQVSPKLQQMTSLPADLDPIVESPNASMSLAFGVFGAPAIVERPERPERPPNFLGDSGCINCKTKR